MIELLNVDCMEYMAGLPDKAFDLAIVDPPYFSGPEKRKFYGREFSGHGVRRIDYKPLLNSWSVPNDEYYKELVRVSKNQIVWGINYFNSFINVPAGRIVWDKCNDHSSFSDCEIASCSLIKSVRIIRYMWCGMMQGKSIKEGNIMQGSKLLNEKKIHPTQKPIKLYKWLLKNYAKPGDKILDTHGGSMSIAIACHEMNFDLTLCEIDKDYYEAGFKRVAEAMKQQVLFNY